MKFSWFKNRELSAEHAVVGEVQTIEGKWRTTRQVDLMCVDDIVQVPIDVLELLLSDIQYLNRTVAEQRDQLARHR